MENSTGKSDYFSYQKSTLELMVDLCSQLADKGLDFEVSLKIKDSFQFSLKSDKKAPGAGGKRGANYRKRQLRRREAFLQKKSGAPPKNTREGGGEGVRTPPPPTPPPQPQPPPPPSPPSNAIRKIFVFFKFHFHNDGHPRPKNYFEMFF